MKKCWAANSFFRPSAKDIDHLLIELIIEDSKPVKNKHANIRKGLHQKPALLYNVFPKCIAGALNTGKKVEAESHEIVTVVFLYIAGFETIAERFATMKVSHLLVCLYQAFDAIADQHHVFKVETIGESYMGVTNLDGSEHDTHIKQVTEYAQDIVHASSRVIINENDLSMDYVQTRVSFHSGPVVSNMMGTLNPCYGLFGDTMNAATCMESNSMPGKIHCTFALAQLLQQQAPNMSVELRSMIKVKEKGKMKTDWIGGSNMTKELPPNLIGICNETPESLNDEEIVSHQNQKDNPTESKPTTLVGRTQRKKAKSFPVETSKGHFIGVQQEIGVLPNLHVYYGRFRFISECNMVLLPTTSVWHNNFLIKGIYCMNVSPGYIIRISLSFPTGLTVSFQKR